jgi:two-component system, chemotaxis family, chemotaxis protein CheY
VEELVALTILIVDDSAMVRRQVTMALVAASFTVLEATDGISGLELLETHPEISLVICDINMPRLNGIELLESIVAKPNKPLFLMLTTERQPELIARAGELGAKGWMMKPFKPDLLLAAVKKLVGLA